MIVLTPRLQSVFEKTRTVCFGRFLFEIPEAVILTWGTAAVPLDVTIYPNEVDKVKEMAQGFEIDLKNKKAIYNNHVPLLISKDDVIHPPGVIIAGYESFEAINALKINGYFKMGDNGVVINARPLKDEKDETILLINRIAKRLRQRAENEFPTESGNCIEHGFLMDELNPSKDDLLEHIRIGFRLKDFSDAHFSIYVAPSNSEGPDEESLYTQWERIKDEPATLEEKKVLANTKFFRESPRQIHDWKTGYEVLTRSPDEDGSHSHHDFQIRFTGVPHDPFKPYVDIQFQTGVAGNAAGATKASLTDEEAIAVWDKIVSTIRVRPTRVMSLEHARADPGAHFPLGELAATGRTCPLTGWWEPSEACESAASQRQYIKAGERMPHAQLLGEPSLWQKIKGERPSYRTAVVWKLVDYEDVPSLTNKTVDKNEPTSSEKKG